MATRFEQALGQHLEQIDTKADPEAERFVLPPEKLDLLGDVLAEAVAGDRGAEEVKRALQLIVALRTTLGAPAASAQIAALLSAIPEARPHLEALGASEARAEDARRFLEQEGRAAPLVAPSVEELADSTGLQVKDLLTPGTSDPVARRPADGPPKETAPQEDDDAGPTEPNPPTVRRGKLGD